jgi:hypothetical protein
LLSVASSNLASRMVSGLEMGCCSEPEETKQFFANARKLKESEIHRMELEAK